MQQSSLMGKPVEETANTKVAARRKGWDTTVTGSSGGLGGFLVLGGVLLATAFTARAALKPRQQRGNKPKADVAGEVGSEGLAAAGAVCRNRSSNNQNKEAREDLLVDPPMEKPTTLAASASTSILPQPPAPTEHPLIPASTHMDGTHSGVCGMDDVKEACASASTYPRDQATKGEQQPDQEPILQDPRDSSLLFQMEPCNSNCSTDKVGANVVLTEPIDSEVDGIKILHLENENLQCQASDKDEENAKVIECGQEEGAGAEVDGTEILLLQNENLPEDTPTQAYDEDDEAKPEDNDEEESGAETSPGLQCSEIPMLLTSIEGQRNIDTTIVDESQISGFLDEALRDDKQREETNHEDGDVDDNVLSYLEDKNQNKTELPSQDSEKSLTFNPREHQNITFKDVPSNTDNLSHTSGIDVCGIDALHSKDALHEEKPQVEPGRADEADKLQVDHEENAPKEKEALLQDLQHSDLFTSTEHHNISSCIAQKSICDPFSQDMDKHELSLIQDRLLQDERFTEEPTAGTIIDKDDEPAEVVVGEIGLLSQHSKYPSQLISLEVNSDLSCINENEFGNLSQKASRDADQLGVLLLQDKLQQDRVFEADDKMCKTDNEESVKEQYQVNHISDSSPDDSIGSNTEASWPMEETDTYSSSDECGMKSQSGIPKNGTEAEKGVPNQQKMVFRDDQQDKGFTATNLASMTKGTGKIDLQIKHARLSILQLAYPLVGLILVFLIVCSHSHVFEPYHLLYKLFYPSSSSS